MVESGAFQAGVLNEAVWEAAVAQGKVDTDKVRVLHTTPPYHDYNWTIRANVDEVYGDGFKRKVQKTLLAIGTDRPELLELFSADGFVASSNSNYAAIQEVAESLGIVE